MGIFTKLVEYLYKLINLISKIIQSELIWKLASYVTQFFFAFILLFIPLAIGWYLLWKLYLNRYEFLRELFGFEKKTSF